MVNVRSEFSSRHLQQVRILGEVRFHTCFFRVIVASTAHGSVMLQHRDRMGSFIMASANRRAISMPLKVCALMWKMKTASRGTGSLTVTRCVIFQLTIMLCDSLNSTTLREICILQQLKHDNIIKCVTRAQPLDSL